MKIYLLLGYLVSVTVSYAQVRTDNGTNSYNDSLNISSRHDKSEVLSNISFLNLYSTAADDAYVKLSLALSYSTIFIELSESMRLQRSQKHLL